MRPAFALVAILFLASCDEPDATADYISAVQAAPVPTDEAGRREACQHVRMNIADQQNRAAIAQTLPPLMAMSAQAQFNSRIAALEDRASRLQCANAFSNTATTPSAAASNPIQQCVAACRANTDRSGAQCFDACNH